jgi:S-formylglutathione hydrolase FrmB
VKSNAKWFAVGLTTLCFGFVAGCSMEESPLGAPSFSTKDPQGIPADFLADLDRNSAEDRDQRLITVAYASDDLLAAPQAPFPVLYLLHDYLGDAGYFERYSLQALLDDMFQKGEIGRMLVVTVDASNYFGGSYYRNSATTGNYEDMLGSTIAVVENNLRTHTRAGKAARAIGGHGMGGYGAVRYALDHPEMFGSVSSLSGPLSLGDPSAGTGVWSEPGGLIQTVFQQNGTGPGDSSLYGKLRAGASLHYDTRNFFAMASAFSPHPLRVFDSLGIKLVPRFPFTGKFDTLYGQEWFSGRPAGVNTVSFTSLVDTFGVGVDLPFDPSGSLSEPVWALWSDSADVKNVFLRKKQENPALWNDMKIYIDVGTEDEFGYLEQNREFRDALTQKSVALTYDEYGPTGALAAGHSDQLFARLKRIIKFHSDNFERPDGPTPQ